MPTKSKLSELKTGSAFKEYVVEEADCSFEDYAKMLNTAIYDGYSTDFRYGGPHKLNLNPPHYYKVFMRKLTEIENVEFLTQEKALVERGDTEKISVTIRHDVDIDIFAAEKQAECEASFGIQSTYYILHTAQYYGYFEEAESDKLVFKRYPFVLDILKKIQGMGHEIAVHTDPLWVYQEHGVDGAQSLLTELNWLRSNGIRIVGTAAHNSEPVYGANNYEVFEERPKNFAFQVDAIEKRKGIKKDGLWIPLGTLSEKTLGLLYEADQIYSMPEYVGTLVDKRLNVIRQKWVSNLDLEERHLQNGEQDRDNAFQSLSALRPGDLLQLVVHPVYYGARGERGHGPEEIDETKNKNITNLIGLASYPPHELVVSLSKNPKRDYDDATISHTNELGFIAKPLESLPINQKVVALIGNSCIFSDRYHVNESLQQILEQTAASKFISYRNFTLGKSIDAHKEISNIRSKLCIDTFLICLSHFPDQALIKSLNSLVLEGYQIAVCSDQKIGSAHLSSEEMRFRFFCGLMENNEWQHSVISAIADYYISIEEKISHTNFAGLLCGEEAPNEPLLNRFFRVLRGRMKGWTKF